MTKLEKMLKYVSEHNDFYKNRIKEYGIKDPLDITQWPVLTRKELQENRYNMFSDGYKSKYYNQQLRRQSSSGSTGMPVNVYWDYKDWYASNMCLWRKRQEWYGIKPGDKYCVFTLNAFGITPEEGKLYYINEPKNILSFNVSLIYDEHGFEQMAELINDFCPDWLYIQPFVLTQLIQAYRKQSTEPPKTIRYIESVGEILVPDLRRRAKELFCIPITNMYGSEEMNGIAIEDSNGEMHVLSDNVFLEVSNESGISQFGDGETIITNLNNFAMPLIRYDQGDRFKQYKSGNSLIEIVGRSICLILDERGEVIFNTLAIFDVLSELNNSFGDPIKSFFFEYYSRRNCLICYVKIEPTGWFDRISKEIIELIKKKLFVEVSIEVCPMSTQLIKKNLIVIK